MLSALGLGGSSVSRTFTFRNRPILEKLRELHTADGLSIVSFQCKSQQGLKLLLYKELLLLFSRSVMGPSVWNGKFSFFSFVFFGFLSSAVGSPLDSGQGWRWQSEHMASLNHLQLIVGDGVEPRDAENLFIEICSRRLLPCCKLSASPSRILLWNDKRLLCTLFLQRCKIVL